MVEVSIFRFEPFHLSVVMLPKLIVHWMNIQTVNLFALNAYAQKRSNGWGG